jgi:hypothetical protein
MRVFLFLSLLFSVNRADGISGVINGGYGTFYNYESGNHSKFDDALLRFNTLLFYRDLSLELDIQARNLTEKISPMGWAGAGYRVLKLNKIPDIWLTGSWIYSEKFSGKTLLVNKVLSAPGAGFMLGMKGQWLKRSFGNFSMSYYPSERAFYKSMQLGWEIWGVGFAAGGLGIRLFEGRYYSSFVFSIRYAFGKVFEEDS